MDSTVVIALVSGFLTMLALTYLFRWLLHLLGVYAVVQERTAVVYVLFGKVVGVLKEPGLHFLWK
ncbi:MAG: SPFH/Band 7/PHB domain protein, partial [Oscillospiraceae bacterium]|nr:SPFH/Band 7/PHB domain protein [Oscillospiraceae bacterium]